MWQPVQNLLLKRSFAWAVFLGTRYHILHGLQGYFTNKFAFYFKIMMNQVKNLYRSYPDKPKFLFSFHCELSHDSFNQVKSADDDLLELVKWMNSEGHLNNTLLIVMSDHGHRQVTLQMDC